MTTLSAITFAHPAALVAFLALPVIWWLLRATPPRPRRVRFAPFRILLGLRQRQQQAARTPWWLLALRLALAAALILAVAGPRIAPPGPSLAANGAKGPLLVILDDGWPSAANWQAMKTALESTLRQAERAARPVILATTAPRAAPVSLAARPARAWLDALSSFVPSALTPDRAALQKRLQELSPAPAHILWLSGGLDHGHAGAFAAALLKLTASVHLLAPPPQRLPLILSPPKLAEGVLHIGLRRAGPRAKDSAQVVLRARNGRPLGEAAARFAPGKTTTSARLSLPLAIRNEAAMLTISSQNHAAATWLFDDSFRRKSVLVLSGESRRRGQPLLSPAYYILRALQPIAEVREIPSIAALDGKLDSTLSMLVLADIGKLDAPHAAAIRKWLRSGGVLVRFAGPRLAAGHDDLVPVRLRSGGRQLGAALSWEKPQGLAPFPKNTPLAGLSPDREIKVTRQVLAEPDANLAAHTWAALEDGTPLITARREGAGLVVLVHTTANPDWSNLPMSGLFVDILARITALAPAARPPGARGKAAAATVALAAPFTPVRALDGFGNLGPIPPDAAPIRAADFATTRPSPRHPPGLYARPGQQRALNATDEETRLAPLPALPAAITRSGYEAAPARDFAPALFVAAFALFVLDLAAMLALSGAGFSLRKQAASAALALFALLLVTLPQPAYAAQDGKQPQSQALQFALRATSRTHLAYVLTGDAQVDEISRAGLTGLSTYLTMRTSVEPGEPFGINLERDEIAFFPLIYWPVTASARPPSARAREKLDIYLKNGGMILFDTRDAADAATRPGTPTPQARALRRILAGLDIPPLEPAPPTHVLTRTFYLLKSWPGRHDSSPLWVEATSAGAERRKLSPGNADGVSAILITGNDMAGAWATSASGRPLLPVIPGGARQREYAIRAGINIVMYALTGNYKADQVHIPAILKRLGQ